MSPKKYSESDQTLSLWGVVWAQDYSHSWPGNERHVDSLWAYLHVSRYYITPHPTVPPPKQPNINEGTIEATSDTITLSWSLGQYIDYSVVTWQRDDSGGGPTTETDEGVSEKIYAPDNTYTIRGLQNNTVYTITVTVYNILGNKTSPTLSHNTINTKKGN